MKTILAVLLVLGVATRMVYCDCSIIKPCPTGEACVRTTQGLVCQPYAKRGQRCSEFAGDLALNPIFSTYPPCDPSRNLECTLKGNRNVCTKQ